MPFTAHRDPSDARLPRQAPHALFLALPVLAVLGVVFLTKVHYDAAPSSPTPVPAVPADDRRLLAQARIQWRSLDALLTPCDAAGGGVGRDQARSQAASRLCSKAGLDLLTFKPPSAAAQFQVRFQTALEACQNDYVRLGNAYDQLARARGREAIDTARADVDRADLEAHGCRIGYIVAARAAGIRFDAFPPPVAGY